MTPEQAKELGAIIAVIVAFSFPIGRAIFKAGKAAKNGTVSSNGRVTTNLTLQLLNTRINDLRDYVNFRFDSIDEQLGEHDHDAS